MSTQHKLLGERIHPSGHQLRKKIQSSRTMKGFRMKPGYLYTVVRAISARVNQNYDGWPSDELKRAHHTFIGKPVFVNHENYDPDKARGVVVASRYVEAGNDKYIEVIQEIDAKRFPILAQEIKTGGLDSVSMGAEAGFTICSACNNKAVDEEDMCDHVKYHKGERLQVRNRRTGKVEEKLVYEACHKLSFFELSYVFDPADETAVASKVIMAGNRRQADATDDYLQKLEDGSLEDERELPTGPATGGGPSKSQSGWLTRQKRKADYVPENSQKTQRPGTLPTYSKAHALFDQLGAPHDKGEGGVLDYGAGLGHSGQWGHTYEPHPQSGFEPTYTDAQDVPENAYHRVTNLNVLNVVPPDIRHQIVDGIGRSMAPGGHAIITTRGAREVMQTKSGVPANNGDPNAIRVNPDTPNETYQKGFTPKELHQYVSDRLGDGYTVNPVKLGPAGVHIVKHGPGTTANLKDIVRTAVLKKAFGEVEAPTEVDTLREEGSAPEDSNNDWEHIVDPPEGLADPDLSQAGRMDRAQDTQEEQQPAEDPAAAGAPEDDGQFMTLKIPVPQPAAVPGQVPGAPPAAVAPAPVAPPAAAAPAPATPPAAPQVPMQAYASVKDLAYFERYFGHRVANWHDAIAAGRTLDPYERADFEREAALLTLENRVSVSTTSRNPVKGTANMARSSTLATRGRTASANGRQHFAETDGVPWGREDEGEQEEAFITPTAPSEPGGLPDDDESNISNTEGNLVADEDYARSLTSKMKRQQAELTRTAQEYARIAGIRKRADEYAGGPVPDVYDPTVQNSAAEALTGDDFQDINPGKGEDTSPAGPGTNSLPHESSLQAFAAFDKWLTASTGRNSRQHSEKNIKKAAKQFADYNGIAVQGMFPALGMVLREARKTEAAKKKGSTMQKRAVDLPAAAPDDRISVPTVTENVTDAEAQASQPDLSGYENNAGDNISDPDLGTGQNWAPGEAPTKSARKADGILAMRCAEAMIDAGLEPNSRERKYQLAAEFQKMSRGLILDRTALAERFAAVRVAERQKVASGRTRGTTLPPGLGSGAPRTASTDRVAANDPANDYTMFG